MNSRGWGLREMLLFCLILTLALLVIVALISTNFFGLLSNKEISGSNIDSARTYNSMEVEIINAAKKYVKAKNISVDTDTYISVVDMQNSHLLNSLYDVIDAGCKCCGYVKVYLKDEISVYEPYLKCGSNYESDGYNSKYDNF